MMGFYKYIRDLWKNPKEKLKELYKNKIIQWRKESAITRINKPTRLDRAHSLGYKAKPGFVLVRVRVKKGGRRRPKPSRGRKPSRMGLTKFSAHKSKQLIAEERAARKYPNLEVLNSYWVGDDSVYEWYEVIMIDTKHPAIINDKDVGRLADQQGRVFRRKTSAGKNKAHRKKK